MRVCVGARLVLVPSGGGLWSFGVQLASGSRVAPGPLGANEMNLVSAASGRARARSCKTNRVLAWSFWNCNNMTQRQQWAGRWLPKERQVRIRYKYKGRD